MGGNPLATLVWYKNGEVQEAETGTQGILSTSTLRLILDQTDNGAEYSCNASNEATPVPLEASVTLNVLCKFEVETLVYVCVCVLGF